MKIKYLLMTFVLILILIGNAGANNINTTHSLVNIGLNNSVLDLSTNNFTVTNSGMTFANITPKYYKNYGVFSNSATTYLSLAANSSFATLPTTNHTLSIWANVTSPASFNTLAFYGGSSGAWQTSNGIYWAFFINNNKLEYQYYIGGTSQTSILSTSTISVANGWHLFTEQVSGTTITLYVDGVAVGSGTVSGYVQSSNPTLVFGYFPGGGLSGSVNGGISDIVITQDDITPTLLPDTYFAANPTASFSANQTYGFAPLSVQFTNTSVGNVVNTSYNWSYTNSSSTGGNGTQVFWSTAASPSQTFGVGNWSINETISNPFGISSATSWVNVSAVLSPPIADFAYSPTSGATPLTVAFTDASQSTITAWNWTFGAANYSSLQNPSYTLVGAGNYSVTLQVTNASGTNSTTKYVLVNSLSDPNPNSTLEYAVTATPQINNQTPVTGTIKLSEVNTNTTWVKINTTWDPTYFGVSNIRVNTSDISGTSLTSSEIHNGYFIANISKDAGIDFTSPGKSLIDFNITMIKYAAPGTAAAFNFTSANSQYYDIGNSTAWTFNHLSGMTAYTGTWEPITANFTSNVTAVAEYAPIQFTDTSTGYPDAWGWDFGDGSTSSAQNPVYSYATTGLKTVSLHSYMAENGTITDTITKTDYINVTAAPPPAPVADFTGTPTTVSLGTAVQFNDTSAYSPTSWSWNFGDSLGSSLQNPSHVYTSIGLYNVSLTATNAQGSDTKTRINYINVTALAPPVASFTSNVTSGAPPLSVQFTDTSINNPTSWHWLISKNSSIYFEYYAQNYNYIFTEDGIYNASLTVSNAAGNSTTWKNITVINLSGFNRQDLYLSPEYTLVLTIKDTDGNVIPVVTVSDSDGNVANTTNGVYTRTYPYEAVAIYLSSSGYQSRSVTYVMNRDRVETVQMTATTTQSQNTNIIYTQQQVRFIVMNSAGTKVNGATISASVMNSTLPSDSLTILQDAFGISANIAGIMLNGSEVMSGTTAGDGSLTFMMFPSLTYNLTITGVPAAPWYISVSPRETEYIIHQPTANVTSSYSNYLNTSITVTEPNSSYITLNAVYQDLSGATTNVKYYVVYRPNNTIIYYRDMGNPGKSAVTDNSVTVPNIRGITYWAYFNKTTV